MNGIFLNSTQANLIVRAITTAVTGAQNKNVNPQPIFDQNNSALNSFSLSHFRPTCPARLIAWNGVVKRKSGDHMYHQSVKDKIACMLVR